MKLGMRANVEYWEYKGAMFAQADSDEQVAFFKAFVKECNTWGTRLKVEMQLAFVNGKLTSEERKTLGMLSYEEGGA